MPAVSTMILNALIQTGEKAIGDTLDTDEQRYYLSRLASMVDSWSNERLMVPVLTQSSWALTNSQGSYTIGTGANFNITRPIRIVDPCFIRDSDSFDSPLTIISMETYGKIVNKTADGTYPSFIAYDYGYSATSTARIYFWPEPDSGLSTYINMLSPLQMLSTVSENLQLQPGYQRAIETNFAIEASPGYTNVTPELIKIAKESKAALKSQNLPVPVSRLDYGAVGGVRTNILTGP